jgi:formate dehydrogenase major subunit
MLRKKANGVAIGSQVSSLLKNVASHKMDRRAFLRSTGLAVGGLAAFSMMPRSVEAAASASSDAKTEIKKSVCTHCSVGCTVMAEVRDGVWVGQEPGWDSPFNLGAHCAKGAAVRELGHGERRLKYPMKLVNGTYTRISWEQAINEIGDQMLKIREESGPDSVYWLGSAKTNNEQSYLYRKFAAYWGTNNIDHQARICHSTTVAGVANTWGYGAMTNSYNDIHNSKAIFLIGGNPAEAHPVSLQHIMKAKEQNNAPVIVCDPRFTRTAAHADEYVRFRPGTDVPLIWGILWHIFENGWEDKEFIRTRVWGMEEIKKEVARWTPEETERVTGTPGSQLERVARTLANNRPGTVIWCMGGTQHHSGNNNTRAYCVLQLALGNMGTTGGGTNIFRGHCNVQGATDLGVLANTLPGYYGLAAGSWAHWARVWEEDLDWLKGRFATMKTKDGKDKAMMNQHGITVSRWIDGVLEAKENLGQPDNTRAMVLWGHAPNSQTRQVDMKAAMEKLDLLVVVDPHPTVSAILHDRKDGAYLLPSTTQFETRGQITNVLCGSLGHIYNNYIIGGLTWLALSTFTVNYIVLPSKFVMLCIGCWTMYLALTAILYATVCAIFDDGMRKLLKDNFWGPIAAVAKNIYDRYRVVIDLLNATPPVAQNGAANNPPPAQARAQRAAAQPRNNAAARAQSPARGGRNRW